MFQVTQQYFMVTLQIKYLTYSYIVKTRMCLNVPFAINFHARNDKKKQCISNMAKWREKGVVNIFLQDFTVSSIHVCVPN